MDTAVMEEAAEYLATPGAEVIVQHSPHHGRGLFASKVFHTGEVILRERPLVALQSLDNRQYVPTCGGCFHFLGSARHHLMVCISRMAELCLAARVRLISSLPDDACV